MRCNIVNNAGVDLGDLEKHIQGMYAHFDERIGFKKPPTLFLDSDPSNASNTLGKTAYYDPQTFEVHVYVDGRHPKDMLRSIAHELIHHQQNLEGRLDVGGYQGEGYYLKNKEMQKIEKEAMLNGNAFLREYEDKLKLEENKTMSIKNWKNKELFENLMGRWGISTNILSESQDKDKDGVIVPNWADQDDNDPDVGAVEEEEEKMDEGQSVRQGTEDRDVGRERMRPDRQHEELELEEEANYSATPAAMAAYVKLKGLKGGDVEEMYVRSLNDRELVMPTEEERAEMKKMMELDESSTMASGAVAGPAVDNLEETLRVAVRAVLESNKEIKKMLKGNK
jgi:hypothetical protein